MSNFKNRIGLLTIVGLSSWVAWLGGLYLFGPDAVVASATISGVVYIIGTLADLKTTETGLDLGASELNPGLPEHPTSTELHGPKQLICDCATLVVGMAVPPTGISVGVDRLKLAFDNLRQIKAFGRPWD